MRIRSRTNRIEKPVFFGSLGAAQGSAAIFSGYKPLKLKEAGNHVFGFRGWKSPLKGCPPLRSAYALPSRIEIPLQSADHITGMLVSKWLHSSVWPKEQ